MVELQAILFMIFVAFGAEQSIILFSGCNYYPQILLTSSGE